MIRFPSVILKRLKAAIGPETAGILIEPIQGEGGVRPVPPEDLRAMRALCDEHGILLVLDEVQCGIGRTGKLFAHEWAGITPDIMAVAKGIGGGFPLGACLATENAAQGMTAGTHGSTYGGNPLATAVGNAVLDVVLEKGFLDNVLQRSLGLKQKLARLKDEHPTVIEDIRGIRPDDGDQVQGSQYGVPGQGHGAQASHHCGGRQCHPPSAAADCH